MNGENRSAEEATETAWPGDPHRPRRGFVKLETTVSWAEVVGAYAVGAFEARGTARRRGVMITTGVTLTAVGGRDPALDAMAVTAFENSLKRRGQMVVRVHRHLAQRHKSHSSQLSTPQDRWWQDQTAHQADRQTRFVYRRGKASGCSTVWASHSGVGIQNRCVDPRQELGLRAALLQLAMVAAV